MSKTQSQQEVIVLIAAFSFINLCIFGQSYGTADPAGTRQQKSMDHG